MTAHGGATHARLAGSNVAKTSTYATHSNALLLCLEPSTGSTHVWPSVLDSSEIRWRLWEDVDFDDIVII